MQIELHVAAKRKQLVTSYPRLNSSREIPPEAAWWGIFDGFFCGNFRPKVASDVLSGAIIDPTGEKVSVNFS